MATHRIICTIQEPSGQPNDVAHIVQVGTGTTATYYDRLWSVDEVVSAMQSGDTFYTQGEQTGKIAQVEIVRCQTCGRYILRSAPDAVRDNNLDNLPRCRI
jgi:hypothetical protein